MSLMCRGKLLAQKSLKRKVSADMRRLSKAIKCTCFHGSMPYSCDKIVFIV